MTSKEVISNAGAIKLTEQDSPDTSQLGEISMIPHECHKPRIFKEGYWY